MPGAGVTGGPRLVLLGTRGGPWPSPLRWGISQALVVNGRSYLVDCGEGVSRQMVKAGLLRMLRNIFITHLHSDHTSDYFNLLLLGWTVIQSNEHPVHVFGPGSAGGASALPGPRAGRPGPPLASPADPTPGIVAMTDHALKAHAYDINVRMREADRLELSCLVAAHEIAIPPEVGASGPDDVAPPMEPVVVTEDDNVRVSAILVRHAPVFPSFAYRFDTDAGSIVVSGDTARCSNLVRLARGADILVHEVVDAEMVMQDSARAAEANPGAVPAWQDATLEHVLSSHTSLADVGKVAAEAGVRKLVLSHFIPSHRTLPDEHWRRGAAANFDGEVVVGRDLLEVAL